MKSMESLSLLGLLVVCLIGILAVLLNLTVIKDTLNKQTHKREYLQGKSFAISWDESLGEYICNVPISESKYFTFTLTKKNVNEFIKDMKIEKEYAEKGNKGIINLVSENKQIKEKLKLKNLEIKDLKRAIALLKEKGKSND